MSRVADPRSQGTKAGGSDSGMSEPMDEMALRHPLITKAAEVGLRIPGSRPIVRELVVRLLHSPLISFHRRQQIFNLFQADLTPVAPRTFSLGVEAGHRIRMGYDPSDDLSRLLYFWGAAGVYEPGFVGVVRQYVRAGSVFLDVGANIGLYTLFAAALVGGRGKVHAFEPNPEVFTDLRRNVDLNGFKNVILNEVAVSDHGGRSELHFPADVRERVAASLVPNFRDSNRHIEVQTESLDNYCKRVSLKRVDMIKIDAEGNDAKVLAGSVGILQRDHPVVLCEVLVGYDDGIHETLDSLGYNAFLITERGPVAAAKVTPDTMYRNYLFVPGHVATDSV